VPVRLNLFADRPESLVVQPAQLESHRNLVQQAYKLFGSHHFAHYDFLLSLSEEIPVRGLEHHQSSSNSDDPKYFGRLGQVALPEGSAAARISAFLERQVQAPREACGPRT